MWHIVSDSCCDLLELPVPAENIDFSSVPFTIHIGDHEYVDDAEIAVEAMLTDNETCKKAATTACPSPQAWLERFSTEGPVLAFTISGALSGSYNSACTAREMLREEQPDKQITVVDSKGTGPKLVLLIRKACELIGQGLGFEEVSRAILEFSERSNIIFALASYHNLIKNGRISRLAGVIAGHLGFWGIGIGDENGQIAMRGKTRGQTKMIRFMTEEIRRIGLTGREIIISHCLNPEAAQRLKDALAELFRQIPILILPTRGLDSFYAERGGLIIGF